MPPRHNFKEFPKEMEQSKLQEKNAKLKKIMQTSLGQNQTQYLNEMKEIREKLEVDDNYCKKFGMLKKASILAYYGRENEAFNEIAKAVQIVKE